MLGSGVKNVPMSREQLLINKVPVSLVHDCSKGGLAVAVSEICMNGQIGCRVSLDSIPGDTLDVDRVLFSESHSRYLVVLNEYGVAQIQSILEKNNVPYDVIGNFGGNAIQFVKSDDSASLVNLDVMTTRQSWLDALSSLLSSSDSD